MRAALRAHYQIDLRAVRRDHSMTPFDLADLAVWLPAGSALWEDVGGPSSISAESRELRRVLFMLRVLDYRERGSKGEKPKPDPEPDYAHERRAKESATKGKAAAYRRRQERMKKS